jgi:competence protein ComEA
VQAISRSQLAAWALAAVLLGIAGVKLLAPHHAARSPAPLRLESQGGSSADAGVGVYVHVAGAVRHPGLLRLARGSRVAAAVERAGGPARGADLAGVNLAARVEDGQQIVVPRRGAVAASGAAAGASGAAPAGAGGAKVSLGSATAEQLDGVDGIGPTLAKRIVEYRQAHGGFRSLADLGQVEGIGDKRLARLRESLQP